MAAPYEQGLALVAGITQLLQNPLPESYEKISASCEKLATTFTHASAAVQAAQAQSDKYEKRLQKLTERNARQSERIVGLGRACDVHDRHVTLLCGQLLTLNREDQRAGSGILRDDPRQMERFALIYELATANTEMDHMVNTYNKLYEELGKMEGRREKMKAKCEAHCVAASKRYEEWDELRLESEALLDEVNVWFKDVVGDGGDHGENT